MGVADHLIGEVRPSLLGNQPDLELTDRYSSMSTVQASVQARAGLKFQHVCLGARRPDSYEGQIQMLHNRLRAALQKMLQTALLGQGDTDIRRQCCQARTFFDQFLGEFPFTDVLDLRDEQERFTRLIMGTGYAEQNPDRLPVLAEVSLLHAEGG